MIRSPVFSFATDNKKPGDDGINTDKSEKTPPVLKKKAAKKPKAAEVEVEAKPKKVAKKAKIASETPEVKKTEH
jgi:hypothetical protein